jgi:ABC-type phosphate transport system substrate-binding protein
LFFFIVFASGGCLVNKHGFIALMLGAFLGLAFPAPAAEQKMRLTGSGASFPYPLLTLSWLLVYQRYPDPAQAAALKQFVDFGLTEGQRHSRELGYMPLPEAIVSRSREALEGIR